MIINAKVATNLLVVLLHGYGTNAEDFKNIGEIFAKTRQDAQIAIPNGFIPLKENRFKWFDLEDDDLDAWKKRIKIASDKLICYIDMQLKDINSKQDKKLSYKNVVIAGFSQGGMMSLHVGLLKEVAGVICFSGFLTDPSVVKKDAKTKILFTHGENDDRLWIALMKESLKQLDDNNIVYETYIEKYMGHQINLNCLNKATEFLENL